MQIGEVCLMTRDVKKIADFYKWLFGIDNGSNDTEHQFLISEGTTLTVCRDYGEREIGHGGICLAFTVEDVETEHERLVSRGVEVLSPPDCTPVGSEEHELSRPGRKRGLLQTNSVTDL